MLAFIPALSVNDADKAAVINRYAGDEGAGADKNINIDFNDKTSIKTITEVVELKWLAADELAEYLRPHLSAYGKIQVNEGMNAILITDSPVKVQNLAAISKNLDNQKNINNFRYGSRTYVLSNNKPEEIVDLVKTRLSVSGVATYNSGLNLLLIKDFEPYLTFVDSLMKNIDLVKKQVMIRMTTVVFEEGQDHEIGIDWDITGAINASAAHSESSDKSITETDFRSSTDHGGAVSLVRDITKVIPKTVSELTRYAGDVTGAAAGIIKVIKSATDGKEISTPTLVITNNKQGYFKTNLFEMRVTPTIGENGNVRMSIEYIITGGSTSISELIIQDDHTFMLSGYSYVLSQTTTKRVPVLGYILPFLFSKEKKEEKKMNTLIFISPKILSTGSDFSEMMDEGVYKSPTKYKQEGLKDVGKYKQEGAKEIELPDGNKKK